MSQLDIALEHFAALLKQWGCTQTHAACQKHIAGTDTIAARRWLYETLRQQEDDVRSGWTKHHSGLLLVEADLIAPCEVDVGAVALINEVDLMPESEEALV